MNLYMNAAILAMMAGEAMAAAATSCQVFSAALGGADQKAIKEAHNRLKSVDADYTCVDGLITTHGGANDADKVKFLKKYPNILMRAVEHPTAASRYDITDLDFPVFAQMKEDIIARFFKKNWESECEDLDLDHFNFLNFMMKKKKLAKLITPACFAAIPGLKHHDTVKNLKNLDAKIFSECEQKLHENYFKEMTPDQIKYFQTHRLLVEDSCSAPWVRLDLVKEKSWASVTPVCAQNWIMNHSKTHKLSFKHISKFQSSQIDKSDNAIFSLLPSAFADDKNGKSAWTKASLDLVQLFAEVGKAQYLIPEAVKPELKITSRAFADMTSAVQGRILAKVEELPDDLFSHMSYQEVNAIEYDDDKNGKKSCKGVACLKLLREKKNFAKIMAHIDSFICLEQPELPFYAQKDNKLIGQHMSRTCFKDLDFDYDTLEQHIRELPENMLQYLSTEDLKRLFDSKDGAVWRELAHDYVDDKKKNRMWPGLLRNPKVCARLVRLYTFDKLAKKDLLGAMDAFDSACLRVFPDFSKLSQQYLAAIGDKVYEAFTKADANLIDYSKSTSVQIGNASARVENVADHYAAALDAESIKKVSSEVWPFMNAGWFKAMHEDTYAAISSDQFKGAQAEKLVDVSATQAGRLSDDVKKNLTPEQITLIGSAGGPNSDAERAMLAVLSAASGSFNEHQAKAFKARQALTDSGAMGAASASLMALVASLALIFPLL